MKIFSSIVKDFFNIALGTWLVLLVLEFFNSGMVQRFINLEFLFYFLFLIYIINKIINR